VSSFEFVVEGPPVSLNAKEGSPRSRKRYRDWMSKVNAAAAVVWPTGQAATKSAAVEVRITNYFTLAPPDIDNIIKPILDALNALVYEDDKQVYRVVSEKADLNQGILVSNPGPSLARALATLEEIIHVVVIWEAEDETDGR
jgi:Holliday junction resolvase RusA-like endonuclease